MGCGACLGEVRKRGPKKNNTWGSLVKGERDAGPEFITQGYESDPTFGLVNTITYLLHNYERHTCGKTKQTSAVCVRVASRVDLRLSRGRGYISTLRPVDALMPCSSLDAIHLLYRFFKPTFADK